MTRVEFSMAVALLVSYLFLTLALFAAALARARKWQGKAARSVANAGAIREALVEYVAGSNDLTRIRSLAATSREEIGEAIFALRVTIAGTARDRLCDLALEAGLVQDWVAQTRSRDLIQRSAALARMAFVSNYEPCRRVTEDHLVKALSDPDDELRLCAARALAYGQDKAALERLFQFAVTENPLVRLILTEDLRRYAVQMCETVVPPVLHSRDTGRILAALEMLVAWQRAVPFEHLRELMDHPERSIRLQALRLAPLVAQNAETRASIARALSEDDLELNSVAAVSAGRLGLTSALPLLSRMVRVGPMELARTAAAALAEITPRGLETLEELASHEDERLAAVAKEALAQVSRRAGV